MSCNPLMTIGRSFRRLGPLGIPRRFCSTSHEVSTSSCDPPLSSGHFEGPSVVADDLLLQAARRSTFVAPKGLNIEACWARMNSLLLDYLARSETARLGDIYLVANVLVGHNRITCMSRDDMVSRVQSTVRSRSRFPNVFTLLQYLRFLRSSATHPASLLVMTSTIQSSRQIKVSEVIEIVSQIARSSWVHSANKHELMDLLRCISDRVSHSRDIDAFSEFNHSNSKQLVEFFFSSFSIPPGTHDTWLQLMMSIMKDRHCASPAGLEGMVDMGLSLIRDDKLESARLVATAIRDHQLTRSKYLRHILADQMMKSKLMDLQTQTRIVLNPNELLDSVRFGPGESLRGITGTYFRESPDVNGAPQYRKGNFVLSFSPCSNCWEIRSDSDSKRRAFISGARDEVPVNQTGWQIYIKKLFDFSDSPYTLGRVTDDGVSRRITQPSSNVALETCIDQLEPVEEPIVDEILQQWPVSSRRETEEKLGARIADLEKLVAGLEDRMHLLEQSRAEERPEEKRDIREHSRPREGIVLRALTRWLVPEVTRVDGPQSFESMRQQVLRNEKLEDKAKLISRKLRS